jgi:hypothetical protein
MAADYGSTYTPRQWTPVGTGIYRKTRPPRPAALGTTPEYAPATAPQAPDASGNSWLRTIQNMLMQNTAARTAGARGSAMRASPNDPSLAAYGQLEGQLQGQSDASGQMWLQQRDTQSFEEKMLRLRAQLEEEIARRAAGNPLMQLLGSAAGTAVGGWAGGLGRKT